MLQYLHQADIVLAACTLFFGTIGVAQLLMATQVLTPVAAQRMGLSQLMLSLAFGSRIFWDGTEFSSALSWSELGYTLNAFLLLSALSHYRTGRELPLWAWALAPWVQLPAMVWLAWPEFGAFGVGVAYILAGLVHAAAWLFCRPDPDYIKTRIFWIFRAQAVLAVLSFIPWGIWVILQPIGRDLRLDRILSAVHFSLAFWICLMTAMAFAYLLMRDMGQDIERRSHTDPLTGTQNRAGLQKHLAERQKKRKPLPGLAAIVIDLDHFKAVNDTHGHLAGDQVLAQCAARLQAQLRADNLLVRLGGEEFLVLLEGVPLEHATAVAERMRLAIQTAPVTMEGGREIQVTTSVGVTVQAGPTEPVTGLIARADQALYKAKQGGRNRVVADMY